MLVTSSFVSAMLTPDVLLARQFVSRAEHGLISGVL
jgi:hypothetical protein